MLLSDEEKSKVIILILTPTNAISDLNNKLFCCYFNDYYGFFHHPDPVNPSSQTEASNIIRMGQSSAPLWMLLLAAK